MDFKISVKCRGEIAIINFQNRKLGQKINKQLKIFSQDPRHPSLRTHKLLGNLTNSWSISIDRNFRLVYTILPDGEAYFYKFGTHGEVYRK